jgi:solute carrier family 25 iron transporter 28/37
LHPLSPQISKGSSSFHTNQRTNNVYRQVADVVTDILKEDGPRGFLRGIGPRVLVHAPSVAISWTVYEGIKHALRTDS